MRETQKQQQKITTSISTSSSSISPINANSLQQEITASGTIDKLKISNNINTSQENNNNNHKSSATTNGSSNSSNGTTTTTTTTTNVKKTNQTDSSLPTQQVPISSATTSSPSSTFQQSDKVKVLKCDNQIKELHTVLRDRETSHSDFKFYSDRLIRLLVEQGLNELPYTECNVTTPAGCPYDGVKYIKGVCGVSIMRSGEAMEKGLRECCRSIRIGKILIQSTDDETRKSSVVYAKFPNDISMRKILLMYPITTTGSTINLAIKTLKEHGVIENNIILLCLFSTPQGLQSVNSQYPGVDILTSEIHPIVPNDFGTRYFGTE